MARFKNAIEHIILMVAGKRHLKVPEMKKITEGISLESMTKLLPTQKKFLDKIKQ